MSSPTKFLPTDDHTTAVVTVIARLRLRRVRSPITGYSSADGAFPVIRYFPNTHFQIEGIVSDQVQPIFNNIARKFRFLFHSPGWHENKNKKIIIINFKNISIVWQCFSLSSSPNKYIYIYIYIPPCNAIDDQPLTGSWTHCQTAFGHRPTDHRPDHGPIPYDGSWTHRSTGSDHLFAVTRFLPNQRPSYGPSREKCRQGNHCFQAIFVSDFFRFFSCFSSCYFENKIKIMKLNVWKNMKIWKYENINIYTQFRELKSRGKINERLA